MFLFVLRALSTPEVLTAWAASCETNLITCVNQIKRLSENQGVRIKVSECEREKQQEDMINYSWNIKKKITIVDFDLIRDQTCRLTLRYFSGKSFSLLNSWVFRSVTSNMESSFFSFTLFFCCWSFLSVTFCMLTVPCVQRHETWPTHRLIHRLMPNLWPGVSVFECVCVDRQVIIHSFRVWSRRSLRHV